MRVQVNGLLPLLKTSIIEYSNGDEVYASFVYENLEKHCSKCFCLNHELRDCLVAKHEHRKIKEQQELDTAKPPPKEQSGQHHQEGSEVLKFSAQRARREIPERYPQRYQTDRQHYDNRRDARYFLDENRRSRSYQFPSRRSQHSHRPMEWREKELPSHSFHQANPDNQYGNKDYEGPGFEKEQTLSRRSPPRFGNNSPSQRKNATRREESNSSKDIRQGESPTTITPDNTK
ncbi:hypothetical protein YC2023_054010 [Brassica napus]